MAVSPPFREAADWKGATLPTKPLDYLLPRCQELWLGNNQLNGTLPAGWSSAWPSTLWRVDLSCNQLEGSIPDWAMPSGPYKPQVFLQQNALSGGRGAACPCSAVEENSGMV